MSKLDKTLTFFEESINGGLLLAATVVLFINVIARYLFSNASTWAEEAIRYAVIWVTFYGGSLCAKNKMHVGIDIFVQKTPPQVTKILLALAQVCSAFFTAFITYYGWVATQLIIETAQKSPAMLMPMWIVYMCMPIGGAFMTFRFLLAAYAILTDKSIESETVTDGSVDMSRL